MSKFKPGILVGAGILALAYSLYSCDAYNNANNLDNESKPTLSSTKEAASLSSDNNSKGDATDSPAKEPAEAATKKNTKGTNSPSGVEQPLENEPTATPSLKSKDENTSESGEGGLIPQTTSPTKKPVSTTSAPKGTDGESPATKKPSTTEPSTNEPAVKTQKQTIEPQVVIPTILNVDAPGSRLYTNDDNTVSVDASNSSKGYIAIKYNGSSGKVKIIITKGDEKYTYNVTKDKYEFYPLQMGNGTYNIGVYENISGTSYMPVFQEDISVSIDNPDSVFLYPNQYVWYTQDSQVVKQSARICAGCETDFDKVSKIFEYVTSTLSYDYDKATNVSTGYLPDISSVLSSKKGICFDYASVFAAMCRVQGIPAKLTTGYVSQNSSMVYHAWNYVYTQDKGWITVSFYLNKKGYNLVDATFYSTISDKESAAEFINNNSNYQAYQYY